ASLCISGVARTIGAIRRRASSIVCGVTARFARAVSSLSDMRRYRSELPGDGAPQPLALEFNLMAGPAATIEIEKQVADRPRLERTDQTGQGLAIGRVERGDFTHRGSAIGDELSGPLLSGKCQCARPRLLRFFKGDNRAVLIQQEMDFAVIHRAYAASIFSCPLRIAAARARTSSG